MRLTYRVLMQWGNGRDHGFLSLCFRATSADMAMFKARMRLCHATLHAYPLRAEARA